MKNQPPYFLRKEPLTSDKTCGYWFVINPKTKKVFSCTLFWESKLISADSYSGDGKRLIAKFTNKRLSNRKLI